MILRFTPRANLLSSWAWGRLLRSWKGVSDAGGKFLDSSSRKKKCSDFARRKAQRMRETHLHRRQRSRVPV